MTAFTLNRLTRREVDAMIDRIVLLEELAATSLMVRRPRGSRICSEH